MNFLPVFDYGADEDATPTASAQSAKPPLNSTRPSSQSKKHNKPAKPTSAADARSKAVYQAMEHLLEQGAMSDAYLLQAVTSLCGDDFLQVAEERALAGMCGNPRCAHSLHTQKAPAHYKVQGRVVYDLEDEMSITCSKKCQAVITMIAQKLGNEDAALYRFTHPTPPTPPAKSHPQVAFFNTVVERDPSAKNPSQTASNSHKDSSPSATQKTMQRAGDHKASPKPSSSQSASKPSAGVGSLSHHPRKQTMPPQQYAAGNAKVPIMLAEIKEKDPSAEAAFAAAASLKQQSMQSAAGEQSAANAVDGFIPKSRPSNAPRPKAHPNSSRKQPIPKQVKFELPNSASAQSTEADTLVRLEQTAHEETTGPAFRQDSDCTSSSQVQGPEQPCSRSKTSEHQPGWSAGQSQDLSEHQGLSTPEQPAHTESQEKTHDGAGQSLEATEEKQQGCGLPATASEPAHSAGAPILSFEIEDADGPLEGATNGLASQFGCLKVIDPDSQVQQEGEPEASPSDRPNQSHLSQNYWNQPLQDDADPSPEDDHDQEFDHADSEGVVSETEGDNDDPSSWLASPPPDFRNELSPFGAIYTLLEAWPTQSTRDYLNSELDAPRQLRQSQMLGTSHEILKTMSRVFARVVPGIIKEMQVHVPRSGVEQHLHDLLASMQFLTPIPAIKDSYWRVLVLVLMRGLSIKRARSLQDTFESRSGLTALKGILDAQAFTDEMFDALLEVLMEG